MSWIRIDNERINLSLVSGYSRAEGRLNVHVTGADGGYWYPDPDGELAAQLDAILGPTELLRSDQKAQ